MKKENRESRNIKDIKKEFLDVISSISRTKSSRWQAWSDVITAIACFLSSSVDRSSEHLQKRLQEYSDCVTRIGSTELIGNLMACIVDAFELNPDQDFLGEMYMGLGLGDSGRGQFFTPYNVSALMSEMLMENTETETSNKGYISICDPTCGSGAMLIAAANTLKNQNYNFQKNAFFVGQDIDRTAALMCYIQISLLGCPGYVCVGNSLTNSVSGISTILPTESEGLELWYTPIFFSDIWERRRMVDLLKLI